MPRYFFHVFYGHTATDHVGEDLADRDAAWKEATVMAGQICRALTAIWCPVANGGWRSPTNSQILYLSCAFSQRADSARVPLKAPAVPSFPGLMGCSDRPLDSRLRSCAVQRTARLTKHWQCAQRRIYG
ncbi:DUF6894 family protein [Bradyrhizobium arachidis]|uniref:DUF6894 family protein n=1 Tax=Bradyrhizobium arachidis TaxID=858423 RepID=UPI003D319984